MACGSVACADFGATGWHQRGGRVGGRRAGSAGLPVREWHHELHIDDDHVGAGSGAVRPGHRRFDKRRQRRRVVLRPAGRVVLPLATLFVAVQLTTTTTTTTSHHGAPDSNGKALPAQTTTTTVASIFAGQVE